LIQEFPCQVGSIFMGDYMVKKLSDGTVIEYEKLPPMNPDEKGDLEQQRINSYFRLHSKK